MSEKVRSLNLTSSVVGGSSTLIGNPTLISSTLSTNHNLTPTVDLITASTLRDSSITPTNLNASIASDMETSSEFATGSITAQLNFQLLSAVVDTTNISSSGVGVGGGSGIIGIIDYNSIMNSSQISAISNDSLLIQPSSQQIQSSHVGALSNNSMALVKAGAGKPVVAQSVAGVSFASNYLF